MATPVYEHRALIFAPETDMHATAVRWVLAQSGVSVVIEPSLGSGAVSFPSLGCNSDRPWRFGRRSRMAEFGSIWYRRPKRWPELENIRECDRSCLQIEWRRFHENLYSISAGISDALWVNSPPAAHRADQKLLQLDVARRCSLPIPETLVSNDVRDIRAFLMRHVEVVHKTFVPHVWQNGDTGELNASWTSRLRPEDLEHEASIALAPAIYQSRVRKGSDLRVVTIGDSMFAFEIRYADGRIPVDWRKESSVVELDVRLIELPESYLRKLRLLMWHLGLSYGCIDLVRDVNGNLYFLEVNQAGEFLFAERLCPDVPLLRSMAAMLKHGRVNYSLDQTANLGLKDFFDSDAHDALLRRQKETKEFSSIPNANLE